MGYVLQRPGGIPTPPGQPSRPTADRHHTLCTTRRPNDQRTQKEDTMAWVGAAIAAGGALISNNQNRKAAAEANQESMDFQAGQSGSAWQRAVADMKEAGLNPMLAYSQGPAATSNYSAQWAQQQNVGQAGVQGYEMASSAQHKQAQRDDIKQEMQTFNERMRQLKIGTQTKHWEEKAAQYRAGILNSEDLESARYFTARAKEMMTKAKLLGLEVPQAIAEAAMWATEFGKALPYAKEGADVGGKILRNFTPARRYQGNQ